VIAAPLRDDGPLRAAQAVVSHAHARWADNAQSQAIMAQLAQYAGGNADLSAFPALAGLFAGHGAMAWVQGFVRAMVEALHDAPLGQVPLRHFTNGVTSSLLLGRAGDSSLALVSLDGGGVSAAQSVSFSPIESHEIVLAGHGRAVLVECDQPGAAKVRLSRQDLALCPGVVVARDGRRQAIQWLGVDGCLVTLRLQRRGRSGKLAYDYDLESQSLLHRAAGGMRESRHALMVNLLGRMGRKDAGPVLAEMAREDGALDLRWQALREGLGLDTARGFAALCAVARRDGDPLQPQARDLRDALVAQHPMLAARV
jgi:hypothetical protein